MRLDVSGEKSVGKSENITEIKKNPPVHNIHNRKKVQGGKITMYNIRFQVQVYHVT